MGKRETVAPDSAVRQQDPLWVMKDVQEYLDVSHVTVRKLIKRGLPHKRIASRLYFRRSEVDAWIDQQVA